MAVIKSSALGQARKSIGPTNYYRRAGVQISRSKPVFAPGRQFTPGQLRQQFRMQVAQAWLLYYGLGKCSNCTNITNNRLYNASSRYNRMVKHILNNPWDVVPADGYTPEETCLEFYDTTLSSWSNGDVKGVPSKISVDFSKSSNLIIVDGVKPIVDELLRLSNRRRSEYNSLTVESIGMCCVIIEKPASGIKSYVILPDFVMDNPDVNNDHLIFTTAPQLFFNSANTYECQMVLFAADGVDMGLAAVEIKALHCTNDFGWMPVELIPKPDRPEIE